MRETRTASKRKAEGPEAGTPPDAAPPAPPAASGTARVRLDKGRGPSERVRRLIPAIRFLFPGAKASLPDLDIQVASKKVEAALLRLTDSPAVRVAAVLKTLDVHAYLAALLDYAQDAAGVAAAPRAAEAALTLTPNGEAVEISSDVLYMLGMYHDAWPLPLTAAGIRASNHPPARSPPPSSSKKRKGATKRDAEDAADGDAGPGAAEEAAKKEENGAAPPLPQVEQQQASGAAQEGPAAQPPPITFQRRRKRGSKQGAEDAGSGAAAAPASAPAGRKKKKTDAPPSPPPREPEAAQEQEPAAPELHQAPAAPEVQERPQPAPEARPQRHSRGNRRTPADAAPLPPAQLQQPEPAATEEPTPAAPAAAEEQEQPVEPQALPLEPQAPPAEAQAPPAEAQAPSVEAQAQPAEAQAPPAAPEAPPAEPQQGLGSNRRIPARKAAAQSPKGYAMDLSSSEDEEEEEEWGGPARRPSSAGASGSSSRSGSRPGSSLLTEEEIHSCYWLRREGLEASCFRNKHDRHNPPAPLRKEDLTSCHDCQGAHKRHVCTSSTCQKSYCQPCCRHYEYLFNAAPDTELDALRERFCAGECPCCLGICVRKMCLRNGRAGAAKAGAVPPLPPPPRPEPADRRVMALHVAACLKGPVAALLADAEREAARQGTTVAAARQMPKAEVDGFRLLCNRCATAMENVMVHCAACDVDICPRCSAELAGGATGALPCPACLQTRNTSLQRALSSRFLDKLAAADAVVAAAVGRGDAAGNAYDYDCKLWRLTKPEDAQGPAAPRQSCQSAPAPRAGSAAPANGLPGPSLAALASGLPVPALAGPANGGAPVLQSAVAAPAPAASLPRPLPGAPLPAASGGASGSADPLQVRTRGEVLGLWNRIPQGPRTVLLAKTADYLQMPKEWHKDPRVNGAVHHVIATMLLPLEELPREWTTSTRGRALAKALRAAKDAMQQAEQAQQVQQAQRLEQAPLLTSSLAAPAPAAALQPLPGVPGPLPLPPRSLAPIPGCIDLVAWHKDLPAQDYRLAAARPDGVQNRVWTPHMSDFAPGAARHHETVQRFVERWAAGEPIIVRGVQGRMNWGPGIVMRAARDVKAGEKDLEVIDCSNWSATCAISADTFFREYTACHGPTAGPNGRPLRMLKLKDFPPDDSFAAKCVRHNADFIDMLNTIMPEYMNPAGGALNMAAQLPATAVPPDLGPKGYIAFGREAEHAGEGDSVTRLHEDLSDAVNVMCHVQCAPKTERGPHPPPRCGEALPAPPSFGGAGALWDLFRRQDIPTLRRFVTDVLAGAVPGCPPFVYKGGRLGPGSVIDPVHDQCIMLTAAHRAAMAAPPYCLHPWVVEQYEGEAVLIPAACVHQVRNLRASIKIALDFVSPESVGHCLAQREERRHLARAERPAVDPAEDVQARHFQDKLQVANMVMHGLKQALDVLEEGEGS